MTTYSLTKTRCVFEKLKLLFQFVLLHATSGKMNLYQQQEERRTKYQVETFSLSCSFLKLIASVVCEMSYAFCRELDICLFYQYLFTSKTDFTICLPAFA
jgi:hypothetical protein